MISCQNSVVSEILMKCISGRSITRNEILLLLKSDEIDSLLYSAALVRNIYKKRIITYSRKIFINIINLCKDYCGYCTYRKEPSSKQAVLMKPNEILELASLGYKYKCTEALIVSGESPEKKYEKAREWLSSLHYKSTVEYVADISDKILRKTGLLPHSNLGILSLDEMRMLKDNNVSLGLMLESSSDRLMNKGMAHEYAPSKNPNLRFKTIENAGKLKIPLTTGILIGIGETAEEVVDSILLIGNLHSRFGHIQEVIIQNFRPKAMTKMENSPPAEMNFFLKVVAISRLLLPDMNIQVPPNLSPYNYGTFIDAGINDWGGISPVTIDHVNPEYAWPNIRELKQNTELKNKTLRARLPIYPEFIKAEFVSSELIHHIDELADEKDGLVKEDYLNDI